MSSQPLPPGLASSVRCCYSACQRTGEAPAMNELMNEQSLSAGRRLPGSQERLMCISVVGAGTQADVFLLCLQAPPPHAPFLSFPTPLSGHTALLGHLFLPVQHILGKSLRFILISIIYMQSLSPSLCFKIFLLLLLLL